MSDEPIVLRHGRVELALHRLRDADGPILLLLHGLGECTPSTVPAAATGWPGPIWGLDFTGHGRSTVPPGGGYTAELLVSDVDHALSHLGPVTIMGRGVGAYVGMLVAGARPSVVRGVVLVDGPGLFGGGSVPGNRPVIQLMVSRPGTAPDPFALVELSRDVRPADYALLFANLALAESGMDEPISVCTVNRPEWLDAVCRLPGVRSTIAAPDALAEHGRAAAGGPEGD